MMRRKKEEVQKEIESGAYVINVQNNNSLFIPVALRKKLGITKNDKVVMTESNGVISIQKIAYEPQKREVETK